LKEELNETLRSLDAIHKLDAVLESSYDPYVLSDASTAIETLRKCAPHSTRKVGLGHYDPIKGDWQYILHLKQLHFDTVGVAWKVWDGGIGFCRWIIQNRNIFEGKKVLEVGSGVGIAGLTAALFAKQVVLSDYTPKLLKVLRKNLKENGTKYAQIHNAAKVISLDWLTEKVPEPLSYDIVIGTEVVYDSKLVKPLANIIHNALTKNGIFLGVSAAVRQGIPDFIASMKELEFDVEAKEFPKQLLPDSKLEYGSNDCIFFVCTKK